MPGTPSRHGPPYVPRYRFGDFVLSPGRRVLLRAGREQPLIPRYFDLLVFLVERRHEAVHRRDIFDRVWRDVIVSDSALSQAIRTIRRALGDDPRESRFIRTVARHGYRFVYADVYEEIDEGPDLGITEPPSPVTGSATGPADDSPRTSAAGIGADPTDLLLERLTGAPRDADEEEDQRDAAERLHGFGTADVLRRLGTRHGHARARALLRDTRWDVPGAGAVPLTGQPGTVAVAALLVTLRLRRAARIAAARWVSAAAGGGLAGVAAGTAGGLLLSAMPGSQAPPAAAIVLGLVGGTCGAIGGAGVGAGLAVAEATARSQRALALVVCAALGGLGVGAIVQWAARWSLAALVGLHVPIGGAFEGLVLGMAIGAGYAVVTRGTGDGLPAPRGRRRLVVAFATAVAAGIGALALTIDGRPLVGGTIHAMAEASQGAQVLLTPLGRLVGDPGFGRFSQALLGTLEGVMFGAGLALGHTRRISRRSHAPLTSS
jgi:DNA-binding winged helix-turn-helix (wHTH) protein